MARKIEPHVTSIEHVKVVGSTSVASTTNRVLCIFAADCGPLEPTQINSQSEFLKVYTPGGSVSRKTHKSFLHALKVSQSMPMLCIRVTADKITKGITNLGVKVATKGDKVLGYETTEDIKVVFEGKNKKHLILVVGDIIFCSEEALGDTDYSDLILEFPDVVPVVIADPGWSDTLNKDDVADFLTKIVTYMRKYSDMDMDLTVSETEVNISAIYSTKPFSVSSPLGITTKAVEEQVDLGDANFILSPTSPSSTDIFSFTISNVMEVVMTDLNYYRFNLAVTSKGEINYYTLSTYPDDIDATGSNMYLEALNEFTPELSIIPIDNNKAVEAIEDIGFGNSGKVIINQDLDNIDIELLNEALDTVEELEGTRISLLFDCGLVNGVYQNRLAILAEALKSLAVLSTPDSTLIPYVIKYVNDLGLDSRSSAWFGYPWNTDKSLVDFPVALSAGCYYIERISANASANQEFAPVYGKLTGLSSGKNLHSNPTPEQRNQLQEASINPIKHSKVDNIAFFTNNLTTLKTLNVLQEEMTRRLVNKIRYEIDFLCETYLSMDWDQSSCDAIASGIKNYFDNNIKNMLRTIEGNPEIHVSLNGLNKVKVDVSIKPKGSIKYINVYYNILSMAS